MTQTLKSPPKTATKKAPEKANTAGLNPFSQDNQPCPLCEADVPFQYVKPRLYAERGKEVDLRPKSVEWQRSGFEHLQPRLYYMRYCPHCLFTAGGEIFKEPTKNCNVSITKIKQNLAALKNDPQKKLILQMLSKGINISALDYYQAFKLNLLAIFQLQTVEQIANRDAMDLGRYCLRLAWLYRDVGTNAELRKQFGPTMNKVVHTLKKGWPAIPWNEKTALEMAENYYQTTLKQSHTVETDMDEVSLLLIITRINLKLGKFKEAHQLLSMAKDKARKFESNTNALLRKQDQGERASGRGQENKSDQGESELTAEQLNKMVEQSRKMKNLTDEVQGIFEDAKEDWQKKQLALAKKIITCHQDKAPEELKALLVSKQIEQSIIQKLFPEENTKKKGLLRLFKKKK